MNDKRDFAKLGLAFALGVSLSAGYVALGQRYLLGQDVVVVEERCPGTSQRALKDAPAWLEGGELELAPLAGEVLIPEGIELWINLDGVWMSGASGQPERVLEWQGGVPPVEQLERGQLPAVREALRQTGTKLDTAVLWTDHRVPGATLAALIETLARAGAQDYAFVVQGRGEQARAYRFSPSLYAESIEGGQWGLGLSLRFNPAGEVAAWMRPLADGRPRLDAPASQPLDLGYEAGARRCIVAPAGRERADQLAEQEAKLCQLAGVGERANVEYILAQAPTIGDLLALRATMASAPGCFEHSTLAGHYDGAAVDDCTAALAPEAMLDYLEEQAASADPSTSMRTEITGLLDKRAIREVVRAHIGEIRSCYNLGLSEDPELEGRVVIDFTIIEGGTVETTYLAEGTDLGAEKVERCMLEALESWRFPSPGKGTVKVSYPFLLSPG